MGPPGGVDLRRFHRRSRVGRALSFEADPARPAIPYLTRLTETALSKVPGSYRERAEALALPATQAPRRVVVKAAPPGIVTALLVAIPISLHKAQQYLACDATLLAAVPVLIIAGRIVLALCRRNAE